MAVLITKVLIAMMAHTTAVALITTDPIAMVAHIVMARITTVAHTGTRLRSMKIDIAETTRATASIVHRAAAGLVHQAPNMAHPLPGKARAPITVRQPSMAHQALIMVHLAPSMVHRLSHMHHLAARPREAVLTHHLAPFLDQYLDHQAPSSVAHQPARMYHLALIVAHLALSIAHQLVAAKATEAAHFPHRAPYLVRRAFNSVIPREVHMHHQVVEPPEVAHTSHPASGIAHRPAHIHMYQAVAARAQEAVQTCHPAPIMAHQVLSTARPAPIIARRPENTPRYQLAAAKATEAAHSSRLARYPALRAFSNVIHREGPKHHPVAARA